MKKTGAVLVAAGMSSRMQDFKPMLPFGNSTIANHIVTVLKDMGLDPIIVVTGYRAERLEAHLAYAGVRFVRNERYRETEMFDSIKIGLQAIEKDCERVMLMPIDTPAIRPETIRQTLMINADLVRTVCKGEPGHPILIRTEMIPLICADDGRRGLRGAMEESGVPITDLEVEDEAIYMDVDTPEEYRELIRWNYNRGECCPMQPLVQVKLMAGEQFFGPGVCELLELIDQTGSIQEACARMDLSYSKGSRMIKAIDRQLGFPAVRRWAGGTGGGGSVLTEEGRNLVNNYQKMVAEIQESTDKIYQKYFGRGICG
ncbi:MAG: NTP transferase domain-containing protein [Eubacteriales bacterium]|nr:NTP transferase domain-containing protein [Eubacteriales bacterium]